MKTSLESTRQDDLPPASSMEGDRATSQTLSSLSAWERRPYMCLGPVIYFTVSQSNKRPVLKKKRRIS